LEPTYMLRVLKCKHTHTDTYIYTTPTLLYWRSTFVWSIFQSFDETFFVISQDYVSVYLCSYVSVYLFVCLSSRAISHKQTNETTKIVTHNQLKFSTGWRFMLKGIRMQIFVLFCIVSLYKLKMYLLLKTQRNTLIPLWRHPLQCLHFKTQCDNK
jgi:hypothetical protein